MESLGARQLQSPARDLEPEKKAVQFPTWLVFLEDGRPRGAGHGEERGRSVGEHKECLSCEQEPGKALLFGGVFLASITLLLELRNGT